MINEYQARAKSTAVYKDQSYPFVALGEESGELQGIWAKHIRKGGTLATLSQAQKDKICDEAGDVIWNVANILEDVGIPLTDCLEANVIKLGGRRIRGELDSLDRT
jgi:NTP pyrophosphatase (non-canonical NTP hydrolase)